MTTRVQTLSRSLVVERSWPVLLDLLILVAGLAVFYGILTVGRSWLAVAQPNADIHLVPHALPLYALYSIVRIGIAYLISLTFAISYGYIAAYNPRIEGFMVALLDILQSIPVLSFLPPVMLAMVSLFPTRQLGLEMGAILLIFTGQVWNMAFSFYSSLKTLPRELREASDIYGFSRSQRFLQLEMPNAAIGLVWNSMVSVAGGWFALIACEMFTLRNNDFRLPGLGSYLQTSASEGNTTAMLWGLGVLLLIIVGTDLLVWRPAIAWADRFKLEQTESAGAPQSRVLTALQHSHSLQMLRRKTCTPLIERFYRAAAKRHIARPSAYGKTRSRSEFAAWSVVALIAFAGAAYAALRAITLLRGVTGHQYLELMIGALATFGRVNLSLVLAALWTIPVGVAIGFNQKLARIAQPLAQIAASVPATALFPVLLLALVRVGGGLGIGSILLMLLGTQWYILFNVIAGAIAIPNDLKEVASLFRFNDLQRWKTLILPGIFPFLITGLVTASGGAWNASIFAEYFRFGGHTLTTTGLGAQINAATDSGQFAVLLAGTLIMSLMVVTVNRLLWRKLFRLGETRYRLDG